ncbi:SRPBCC domain-containing protein [Aliikangiella coralliicola]|uniref:SRPBCC domain-containing protein n=1 Tax=Aliikangiella coralliicola TaxID=2592383 RepID=A0A545UFV4_9GAMM|nr:SRPBCC domain-containing protein [Aliikangiella coralliicola]TQV88347.1 SRPBCC domain-containing protein [Aliikangiella coralliicola]
MKKFVFLLTLVLSFNLQAELISQDDYGFEIKIEKTVPVSQAKAYQQFLNVGQWWNAEHTWFGRSENLSIEAKAGGCFCEFNGDKQALHMLVSYVHPNNEIRMIGGLGPLQGLGVHGGMSWRFVKIDENKTKIIFNYKVVGRMEGGLKTLGPVVDGVLNIQIMGLVSRVRQS